MYQLVTYSIETRDVYDVMFEAYSDTDAIDKAFTIALQLPDWVMTPCQARLYRSRGNAPPFWAFEDV